MFCMNCGTKLPDNAKFCYQCGEKINVGGEQNSVQEVKSSAPVTDSEKKTAEKNNVTTENKEQNSPKDKNTALNNNGKTKNSKNSEETIEPGGMDFYVLGRKVHVDERTVQTDMIQRKYVALAYEKSNKARKEFIDSFEQVTDLNSIRRLFIDTVEANCHEAIDLAYDEFIKDKLFHIKKDSFDKMLYRRIDESAGMQSIQKGIGNIAAMKSQLAYEKEANKANWVGGGFGISGAIKGAVQAKALNMAQDGLTSLAKSVTGNSDSAKLRRYAEAQVGSVNTYAESVAQVVYQFIRTYLPEDIVYEKNKIRQKNGLRGYNNLLRTTKETVNWCRNIVELFKSERITQDEAIDELCKSLGSRTDRIELYRGILEVDINAYEGLSDIAKFDGYEHLLAQDYFRINKERLQKALAPYIGEKAYKYTWIRQAATDLDLKPIITNLKLNSLNETQEIDSKKQITIQLINNTFHIDPEAIHNELASSNIELIFEGLGDNARVIVKSDEPLPKKYGNFITFENVKLDKDYLNLLKSASSELKTLSEEAIKAGDVDKAIEYLKQMLQMNDDEAAFKIAKLYLNEKHDWENALAYFEQCPNDNVEALVLMAEIQKEKLDNKKKYEQLLNRAAEIYLAEAGKANKKNDRAGVLNNLDKAVKCNSGEAYCRYGTLYEKGKYVERDIQKAIEYYKKGIELNNKNAQIRLSYCYLNIGSEYEKTDIDKAVEYYKMSIELENSDAHEKLVDLYLKLGSKCEKTDVQKAIEYYKKGIELESSEAKNKLANLYLDLGSECEKTDTQKAIEYYKASIDLGNLKAHKKFAGLYLNLGSECEKTDVQQAIEYYKLAFEMDNEKAAIKLGDLYSNKSLPAIYNYSSAMTWYKLVESSEEGREAIQKLKENGKLAERLSFFITFYAPKFEGTYYYFYPSVSKDAFKNAAKSYANDFSIAYNDALVLYDSTHSMFFGKGKTGFIITSDGYLVTSQMSMIALKDVEKLSSVSKGKVIALPSKETVFEIKSRLDKSDLAFMEALNNDVLIEKSVDKRNFGDGVTSHNQVAKEPKEIAFSQNNLEPDYSNGYIVNQSTESDHTSEPLPKKSSKSIKEFDYPIFNLRNLLCLILGEKYYQGIDVQKNYEEAFKWYQKAADAGCIEAMKKLAFCYIEGKGVSKDEACAIKWLKNYVMTEIDSNSQNSELPKLMSVIGDIYFNGLDGYDEGDDGYDEGDDGYDEDDDGYDEDDDGYDEDDDGYDEDDSDYREDYRNAIKWYRMAWEAGYEKAKEHLADALDLLARDLESYEDYTEAIKVYQEAANLGRHDAMVELGSIYNEGKGVAVDYEKAKYWYQKAADLGSVKSMVELGSIYNEGKGVAVDYEKAKYWYQKAADLGSVNSMVELGSIYNEGKGVAVDYEKAKYWYQKAADLGDKRARSYVDFLDRQIKRREKKTKKDDGGCFITTAVCSSLNKPDDCDELMTMRRYRDKLKAEDPDMAALISEYYRTAPLVVKKIDNDSDASLVYRQLWEDSISKIYHSLKKKEYRDATIRYVDMFERLCKKYDTPLACGIQDKIKAIRQRN